VDLVAIDDGHLADARAAQHLGSIGTDTAETNNQNVSLAQLQKLFRAKK